VHQRPHGNPHTQPALYPTCAQRADDKRNKASREGTPRALARHSARRRSRTDRCRSPSSRRCLERRIAKRLENVNSIQGFRPRHEWIDNGRRVDRRQQPMCGPKTRRRVDRRHADMAAKVAAHPCAEVERTENEGTHRTSATPSVGEPKLTWVPGDAKGHAPLDGARAGWGQTSVHLRSRSAATSAQLRSVLMPQLLSSNGGLRQGQTGQRFPGRCLGRRRPLANLREELAGPRLVEQAFHLKRYLTLATHHHLLRKAQRGKDIQMPQEG